MYAANPSGPLSILARAPATTAAEVLALERDGLVVRGRAMRTSAFVLPASSAPMVTAATGQPLERFAWMLRAAGVAPDAFEAARAAVVSAAGEPRTARELRSAAALDGIDVARLVSYLALRGDLVTLGPASVTSNENRYVARVACDALRPPERHRVRGGGSGARRRTRLAHGSPGHTCAPSGRHEWRISPGGPGSPDPRPRRHSLPTRPWTPVAGSCSWPGTCPPTRRLRPSPVSSSWRPSGTRGRWATRSTAASRFVDRDVHDRLFDGDGNGLGAVLVAGRAVGAWGHRGVRGRMEADLDLFERPTARLREAIEARLGAIATFLGYRELRIREVPTVVPDRPTGAAPAQ